MEETRQRTVRIDVWIDDRLTAYARRTRRTVNAAVNYLLGEALEGERPAGSPAPADGVSGHRSGTSTPHGGGAQSAGDR